MRIQASCPATGFCCLDVSGRHVVACTAAKSEANTMMISVLNTQQNLKECYFLKKQAVRITYVQRRAYIHPPGDPASLPPLHLKSVEIRQKSKLMLTGQKKRFYHLFSP